MPEALTRLLPSLVAPMSKQFNLFEVLHHGTHEKQLSNLFAWLFDASETHMLQGRFVKHFVAEVNAELTRLGQPRINAEDYIVSQEQNTAAEGMGADIADIVLLGAKAALVIENYYTSDGHGHSYQNYLDHGYRLGAKRSVVVMLCEVLDTGLLVDGWENAPVVTYGNVLRRLHEDLKGDRRYQRRHPDLMWFFKQIAAYFVEGSPVNNEAIADFIKAVGDTGTAMLYGALNAREQFVQKVTDEAEEKYDASVELLRQAKIKIRNYLNSNLPYLNEALGEERFTSVSGRANGIYLWSVQLIGIGRGINVSLGPSAWYRNEHHQDSGWDTPVADPDYSKVFIGNVDTLTLYQSTMSVADVLTDLTPDNTTLLDEIIDIARATSAKDT